MLSNRKTSTRCKSNLFFMEKYDQTADLPRITDEFEQLIGMLTTEYKQSRLDSIYYLGGSHDLINSIDYRISNEIL